MAKPPPFIKLFGITIMIREAEDHELMGEKTAECYPSAALIIYDEACDDEELRDTILHEIIHLIDFKTTGDYNLKEREVCRIAAGITHLLRDNPHFAGWMVDDE